MKVTLTRELLQNASADVLAYGAKDTGEMGGGAANAILVAAGPSLRDELKRQLALTPRTVGTVVFTEPFNLAARGVKSVCHVVSIIKDTPKGAYCPEPEKLQQGVIAALEGCRSRGLTTLAIAALGTGEGCVRPADAARLMLGGMKMLRARYPSETLDVEICLPTFDDYEAFRIVRDKGEAWV